MKTSTMECSFSYVVCTKFKLRYSSVYFYLSGDGGINPAFSKLRSVR